MKEFNKCITQMTGVVILIGLIVYIVASLIEFFPARATWNSIGIGVFIGSIVTIVYEYIIQELYKN